ncbi:hypothetical protein BDZ89DRAFT_1156287 [Hymenopellis radicata]|nr:hypothetical protein BDZ89DRAFT_1156287 [Hymenopellis radicata]
MPDDSDAEGLLRAGVMQSGSPLPVGELKMANNWHYDDIVDRIGCIGSPDTLACVPYDTFKAAADSSPYFFGYQAMADFAMEAASR